MADIQLPNNFELRTEFVNITEGLSQDLTDIAHWHIEKRTDSYLKRYVDKEDAEAHFHLHVEKNSNNLYECKFNALLDGHKFYWNNDVPFKEPKDVVNHAFKHLKEHLSNHK